MFLFACDNEKARLSKSLENCADSSLNQTISAKNINPYLIKIKEYREYLDYVYSEIPIGQRNKKLSKEENIYNYQPILKKESLIYKNKFDQFDIDLKIKTILSFDIKRKSYIKKTISKIPLKEKKLFENYIVYFGLCENENKLNPETFKLKYGEFKNK